MSSIKVGMESMSSIAIFSRSEEGLIVVVENGRVIEALNSMDKLLESSKYANSTSRSVVVPGFFELIVQSRERAIQECAEWYRKYVADERVARELAEIEIKHQEKMIARVGIHRLTNKACSTAGGAL